MPRKVMVLKYKYIITAPIPDSFDLTTFFSYRFFFVSGHIFISDQLSHACKRFEWRTAHLWTTENPPCPSDRVGEHVKEVDRMNI